MPPTQMTIALGQMAVQHGAPAANLARAREMAARAAAAGADLLLLPELWGSGYDLEQAGDHATAPTRGLFAEMAALAREHDLWVGGSLLARDTPAQPRPTNLFALFDRQGRLAGRYAKVHLFRLMDEERWLAAGTSRSVVTTPWGQTALAICYDLRFPELFRAYALEGAALILLPAEWPNPRKTHWRTLLQARAIENQCFVAACNRVGSDPDGTTFFGHSTVIDPWGERLVEGDDSEALLLATLDLERVQESRHRIPVFEDRRPHLY